VAAPLTLFTIGFTKKSAEQFFTLLQQAGVARVLDTRLHNRSQLAGFAKQEDLQYFLRALGGIDYHHLLELAPTEEMLTAFKKEKGPWSEYQARFLALLRARRVENTVPRELIDRGCLLCSEDSPEHCHRRLVAEYLAEQWRNVEIVHLGTSGSSPGRFRADG
jgi:uncharacterized protein (DUF488 family)